MEKRHYSIRNINISKRLFYSFVLMSVVPLIIFAIISRTTAYNAIANKTSVYSVQLLNSVSKNLQYEARNYMNLADDIMLNDLIQYALSPYSASSAEQNKNVEEFYKLVPDVRNFEHPEKHTNYELWSLIQQGEFQTRLKAYTSSKMANFSFLKDIIILNAEDRSIHGFGFSLLSNETIKRCIALRESDDKTNWLSVSESGQNFVVYVQPIRQFGVSQSLGHILLLINPDAFSSCMSTIDFGKNSNMILLDTYGNVLAGTNADSKLGKPLKNNIYSMFAESNGLFYNYEFESETSMISYQRLSEEGWLLFTAIPNSYLRLEMNSINVTTVLLVLFCLFTSFMVYRIMWGSISRPINRLVQLLSKTSEQNFDQVIIDDSRDELGFLGRAYNQIAINMRNMVTQVEREQQQKREYELKMLQAQINPHFLFNALNSLRFTAMMSKAPNVSNGLAALSDLLKNTIIDKNEFVTIDGELKNIENYVTIQRLRYGNIFTVHYDASEQVRALYTIKFLLQPIVENSIIHGLNEDSTANEIYIRVQREGEKLITVIQDNGIGFDVTKLSDENVRRKQLSGIGVNNVKQRIALYFGEEYQFLVESAEGVGTVVTVETPVLEEPPDRNVQRMGERDEMDD